MFVLVIKVVTKTTFDDGSRDSRSLDRRILTCASIVRRCTSRCNVPRCISTVRTVVVRRSKNEKASPVRYSRDPCGAEFPRAPNSVASPSCSVRIKMRAFTSYVERTKYDDPRSLSGLGLT